MNDELLASDMHELLARELLNRLKSNVPCEKCGRSAATIQELTLIRQFLSDNGVTGGLMGRAPAASVVTSKLPVFDDEEGHLHPGVQSK